MSPEKREVMCFLILTSCSYNMQNCKIALQARIQVNKCSCHVFLQFFLNHSSKNQQLHINSTQLTKLRTRKSFRKWVRNLMTCKIKCYLLLCLHSKYRTQHLISECPSWKRDPSCKCSSRGFDRFNFLIRDFCSRVFPYPRVSGERTYRL